MIENEGRQILVGWNPNNIVGMESTTGRLLWKIPYPVTYGVSIATPIYQKGHILVSGYWEGTKLIALNPQLDKATLVWEENQFLRGLMSQPLYRNDHVYLLDKTRGITCFNLITGKVRWSDQNKLTSFASLPIKCWRVPRRLPRLILRRNRRISGNSTG